MASSNRTRRQYGSGGITQRKDGRWMGRIDAGFTREGKRRQLTVYGSTEAEAKRKLEKKKGQIAREGVSVATHTRATVKSYAEAWLKHRATVSRPNAHAADRSAVRNWIIPVLGRRRLESLTPADVRALAKAQRDAGNASSSALRTHAVLVKMLRDAIVEGHDVPQRLLLVEAPSKGTSDRDAIPTDQAVAMLAQASRLPHGSIHATRLLQGLRPGETLGLTWPRIDFAKHLMTIDWQLQTLRYLDRARPELGFRIPDGYEARQLVDSFHLVRPKSEAGWRVIPMIPWIETALLAWREVAPASPWDLVWPTATGRPVSKASDTLEWRGLQGAASVVEHQDGNGVDLADVVVGHPEGRYWVPQEARHTTATLLLEAGVDPKIITAIMGHSTIVVTRGYQHARVEQAAAALEQIAAQLQLGSSTPRGIH